MFRLLPFLALLTTTVGAAAQTVTVADLTQTTRDVHYTSRSVIRVNARLRFTTMIILPDKEEILDFVCGDKDFWIVSGAQNMAYVKPAKAGATTNLNLVTASGAVYSFLLTEGTGEPDLKLYVSPDDTVPAAGATGKKYYSVEEVAELRLAAETARKDADAVRAEMARTIEERIGKFRASYPTELKFPYRFKVNEKPFNVSAIYTDGTFTYIRANASELPSLYEVRDNAPNLINFQVENGVYIVPKVLASGYLAIGKQRFPFETAR